ncbi:choline ABC transporter permease subunit [Tistrella bauzanensis]|uniref:Choline ABC transporter permease subunit n=1 Tax=Tistrella bauzanensis TaxID=657419 RepID=A0ABQ1IAA1_9PROT|nr:proline/glycine betaine ABC transporter permease [Tistrella bauzanensis]GGB29006.1 choline ABC transporter permease subunit [Tistrella bauzanensis]
MSDLGFTLPIGDGVEAVVEFLLDNFTPAFDAIADVVKAVVDAFAVALAWMPWWIMIIIITAIAFWRVGRGFAVFVIVALFALVGMDLWDATMRSLSLVIASTLLSLAIGLPLGIAAARSDRVENMLRPALDLMQTMPPFVYLIPAVMFFGLGQVPGAIATVIFSMPPAVRLTALGIRQVPAEMVEAGRAFGCSDRQLLYKVQLPNALPAIMAGVNQTIMLSLSMVVIASMIGAGGLGNEVLRGIQRLDIGLGFEAGLGVVVLAIVLDRLTQSVGRSKARKR